MNLIQQTIVIADASELKTFNCKSMGVLPRFVYVTRSREMSHLSTTTTKIQFLMPLSHNFKMLYFDANPIQMGYLVTEL